jgi:hypothetical protein
MEYQSDPAFLEPHVGTRVLDRHGNVVGRDPNPGQIRKMCQAIRQTWDESREIQALGRTVRFDRDAQQNRMSEATHIPHGISAEEIGADRCLDLML